MGTILKTILELNGLDSTTATNFKSLADFIYTSYSELDYNAISIDDDDVINATALKFYLYNNAERVIKFAPLFTETMFPDAGKYKTQAFTDTIQYKNITNQTSGRAVINEYSPLGAGESETIVSPSSKEKINDSTEKVSEDQTNTETITNTEHEHEPLLDFMKIKEKGISAYALVDKFLQQIIYEFNYIT